MTGLREIPDELVADLERGRCVAFVGAGFTAPAGLPTWNELLASLADAEPVSPETRARVKRTLQGGARVSAHDLDTIGQLLSDELGRPRFVAHLREMLTVDVLPPAMQLRLERLAEIPFRAIVTTNFDPVIEGAVPSAEIYRELLRPKVYRWWERAFWEERRGAPVIKLHGDLSAPAGREHIVFTRRDYRRRLYGDSAYMTFLQGLLSTNTVLFLGFSLRDAYLNELRSRILALFDHDRHQRPLAYAVLADTPELMRHHLEKHEGIKVLHHDTRGGADFSGFDEHLEAIWRRTAVLPRFGDLLRGRRILWCDAHPENNTTGLSFLRRATGKVGSETVNEVHQVKSAEEALAALRADGKRFDLVVTNWGEGDARDDRGKPLPTAIRLLKTMRAEDLRAPVVVFSRAFALEKRKPAVLELGALAYCFRWETLFRTIDRVLRPGSRTG